MLYKIICCDAQFYLYHPLFVPHKITNHSCTLSTGTTTFLPTKLTRVARVILELWHMEIAGNIKENLIVHRSENNLIIPPRLQEIHYLDSTHTSCRHPASCPAGKRREWPLMSQPVYLHTAFRSRRKEGGYELPSSKYLSHQIQPVSAIRKCCHLVTKGLWSSLSSPE